MTYFDKDVRIECKYKWKEDKNFLIIYFLVTRQNSGVRYIKYILKYFLNVTYFKIAFLALTH